MLPTTYRGNALIDGERISGVLHLSSDSVRLALDNNQEILRWPIGSLQVDAHGKGSYEMRHGNQSFTFEPAVDDGLQDEISLRRRFFAPPTEFETPEPPAQPATPAHPDGSPPPEPPSESLSARVAAAGRHSDGRSLLTGAGDRFRRYLLVGSLGLILLILFAIAITVITTDDPTAGAAEDPVATTLPVPPTTAPAPPSTAEPVPTTTPATPSTSPPAVAGATVTTTPPTTVARAGTIFEIAPSALAERWDIAVGAHSSGLVSGTVRENDGEFSFDAGPFVRLQGSVQDGTVSRFAFVGDPSGTVEDDREVLTGLGMALSLVEPRLPPEGRRELLLALGLDVENPDLGGLDSTIEYRGHRYWLRWDGGLERLVLDVRPSDEPAGDDELTESEDGDS